MIYIRIYFITESQQGRLQAAPHTKKTKRNVGQTYTKNSGVIWHLRWVGFLCWSLLNSEILHIAASEDNVLIHAVRRRDLLIRVVLAALSSKRCHILESDSGLLRVDLVQCADIATSVSKVHVAEARSRASRTGCHFSRPAIFAICRPPRQQEARKLKARP
jgi:hypothetical protein